MMMIKFLLFSLVVISPISIYGDEDLMKMECDNAKNPTLCMQCLNSNPNSGTADAAGIADIVIDCLAVTLNNLHNLITELLPPEEGKDDVQTALEDCTTDMSNALTIVAQAKEALEHGDYSNAGDLVTNALDPTAKCQANLLNVQFEAPQVFSQLNNYALLSGVALKIINGL